MITVELLFGGTAFPSVIREMPAVPRIGEMVTVHGEDNPIDDQNSFRVKDVWWTLTSEALQKRVLVSILLGL